MATKRKAQKKSKLRHAEYYDFQEIQDKLYADSKKGKTFQNLVSIIALPENIRLAYRNIKKNKGSKTAGTDNRTIKDLEKFSVEQLIAIVQRKLGWYTPQKRVRCLRTRNTITRCSWAKMRTVYMYLKNRANKDKSCFPAIGTIASDLSLSRSTVFRALDDLEQKGFIKRKARWRTKGGRSSSLYTLNDP